MGAEPTGPPHEMPPALVAGLARAWGESFPEGRRPALKVQEQGGILVEKGGVLDWRRGDPLPIDAKGDRSFKMNYQDYDKNTETLVATAHTHPYTKAQGDLVGMPFSEGDLADFVTAPERRQYVRSGETIFMVQLTPAFDAWLQKATAKAGGDTERVKLEILRTYAKAENEAAQQKLRLQEQAEAGVIAVAKKYGLEFFKGKDSTLHRVFPP
jgi:hypothetical protein